MNSSGVLTTELIQVDNVNKYDLEDLNHSYSNNYFKYDVYRAWILGNMRILFKLRC